MEQKPKQILDEKVKEALREFYNATGVVVEKYEIQLGFEDEGAGEYFSHLTVI